METEFENLKNKFLEIKNMEWVESCRKGSTGCGRTFEKLLGIQENNLEIPDYLGIEIKVKRSYSNSFTTLFNCTPEGPHYYEIDRIKEKYGYPDKVLKETKILHNSIYCNQKIKINDSHYFQLYINETEKKLYLKVIDQNGNIIEDEVYWTFDLLKEKLYRKLKNIAIISTLRKIESGKEYFKYYKLELYKLKNFETFINLLKIGIIRVTFKIGVFRSGDKKGKIHDHGTGFDIEEKNLYKLYDKYL